MKTGHIFLYFIISLIVGSCSQPKSSPIMGAWRWVSVKYMVGDTVKWNKIITTPEESGIKMWSKDYFVCVNRSKTDSETDSIFDYVYSGGTYKLEGNRYEETITYHYEINTPDLVGLKMMMLLEIKNDTLIQTYPVDEDGKVLKHYTYIEKFVRLD